MQVVDGKEVDAFSNQSDGLKSALVLAARQVLDTRLGDRDGVDQVLQHDPVEGAGVDHLVHVILSF